MKRPNFVSKDIGNVLIKGSCKEVSEGYDITSSGEDIWDQNDEFHFAYTEQIGDFDLIARIESLSESQLYTKAGLMARENLDCGSKHAFILVFPDNSPRNNNNGGYEFQYRNKNGGYSEAIYPNDATSLNPEFPVNFPSTWIRLKRNDNIFTGLYSCDGKSWKEYGSCSIDINKKLYLGLAITSHNSNESAICKFRDISII